MIHAAAHILLAGGSSPSWWDRHSDLIWGAIIGAVVTILISWVFWKLGDKPSRLEWSVLEYVPILNTEVSNSDLKVMHLGNEVKSPYVVAVRVMNTGKTSFEASQFHEPITITFGNNELEWLIAEISSSDQRAKIAHSPDSISNFRYEFTPDLLNPGDYVDVRFIFDGEPDLAVSTRVPGVTALNQVDSFQRITAGQLGSLFLRALLSGVRGGVGISIEVNDPRDKVRMRKPL